MAQFDWGTLNPLTESGTQLMTDLNAFRSAIISSHIGSTRPTYLGAGGTWINNATTPWVVYWCTTSVSGGDVIMGYINPSTLVFTGSPDEGFLSKSVAGASNITLTALESMNVIFEFTGVLTADITVIVPNNKKRYQVDNLTTGNFTLTVKTAVGAGVIIPQGDTLGLYCNGTNIEDANTMKVDTTGSTGSAVLPKGTTAQRDAIPLSGFLRYNTDISGVEVYKGAAWEPMAGAPLASPAFTGTPTAPTAAPTTNTTQLATTAFVQSLVAPGTLALSLTGGTTTLTSVQVLNSAFEFSGTLTSNAVIIVPNSMVLKSFENLTTGAFTLTVKTAAGTGSIVESGAKIAMYANGTNAESLVGLGYGQTWQTVTRVSGTTYTNTTSKPIFLMYSVTSGASTAGSITVTIGGAVVVYSYIPAITGVANSAWVSGIVPPGSTYSTTYIGTPSPFAELR